MGLLNIFIPTTLTVVMGMAVMPQFVVAEPELVMAQILFRHGMRAPDSPYPTDPFQDENLYWPNGWGQLTDFGKEQQYLLGKFLRARYGSGSPLGLNLDPLCNRTEISVISTDYERTIASAALTLAGLYPNEEEFANEFSYSLLDWQPIPVRTLGDGQTRLMLHLSYLQIPAVCPRLFKWFHEEMMAHPDVERTMQANAGLISLIQERTGFGDALPWFHLAAGFMMGAIYVQRFYNMSIPDWAVDVIDDPRNLELFGESFSYLTLTDDAKRLAGGPLLKEWIDNMKGVGKVDAKKLYVYSAHDLNLATMLNTMGLFSPTLTPEMGSTLFVELYKDSDILDIFTVHLYYRDGMTTEMKQLHLPGCSTPCTLDSFERTMSKFLPDDLEKECQLAEEDDGGPILDGDNDPDFTTLEAWLIGVVCVLGVALLAMAAFGYIKIRHR